MKLPSWMLTWLKSYGIAADGLLAEILRLADKLDLPEEWQDRLSLWFQEHTTLDSDKIMVFVTTIYSELTSPAPGYDPNHGGDV